MAWVLSLSSQGKLTHTVMSHRNGEGSTNAAGAMKIGIDSAERARANDLSCTRKYPENRVITYRPCTSQSPFPSNAHIKCIYLKRAEPAKRRV